MENVQDMNIWNEERRVVYHSVLGISMGLVSAGLCRLVHDAIHDAFPEDGPMIAAASMIIQFTIITGIMLLGIFTIPAFHRELRLTLPCLVWSTWYFGTQIFFFEELEKIVRGKYD